MPRPTRLPLALRREMLARARGDDLWKRRSAILCQLARTDPDGVRRYVAKNADRLSGLSRLGACLLG